MERDTSREASARRATQSELEQLHRATNELYASESVSQCTQLTVDVAISILGFDWCVVISADEDAGTFEIVATAGDTKLTVGDRPMRLDEGVVGEVYEHGEPQIIDDAKRHGKPLDERIESAITLPVSDWGVFQALGTEPGAFTERDLQLLELLVTPLATTIERIRTEKALRERTRALERQNDQIAALHTYATRMKAATEREEIYDRCIEAVEEVLEITFCALTEREGDVLKARAVGTEMDLADYYTEKPLVDEDSTAVRTYRRGETIVVDDLREKSKAAPANSEFRSLISVPLGDWGVFQAATTEKSAFDETDRRLIELLADAADAAISRIEREQTLKQRARRLERQNERLDKFASVISHDLRNPLNVAQLGVEGERTERDGEQLAVASDALERMDEMIDDMLTLARAETSVENIEPIDLKLAVEHAWETVQTGDAALDVKLPPDVTVNGEASLLRSIFENLFSNAVRHNDSQVTVRVGLLGGDETSTDGGGHPAGFYVEDDGTGIPEHERETVFKYGYTTDRKGSGLGLSIVRDFVEAHGWLIRVTDGTDGGSRFEIELR